MSDWKSKHDVTDQGAFNAGVYGQPNSTWDIARAQEESSKLRMSQTACTPPAVQPDFQFGQSAPPLYLPPAVGYAYTAPPGKLRKRFLAVLALGIAAYCIVAWFPSLTTLVLGLTQKNRVTSALDVAHYENLPGGAIDWANQPTSRLYATHFKDTAPAWPSMQESQKKAVAAAWIRYTMNPGSFERLPPRQKAFVFKTFEGYLGSLASLGDANAAKDLERIKSSPR